jgi:hypothetical protein
LVLSPAKLLSLSSRRHIFQLRRWAWYVWTLLPSGVVRDCR